MPPPHDLPHPAGFNRLVDGVNVRRIKLYDVRHAHAALSLDQDVDPKAVSDRIGHANMNVAFQIHPPFDRPGPGGGPGRRRPDPRSGGRHHGLTCARVARSYLESRYV